MSMNFYPKGYQQERQHAEHKELFPEHHDFSGVSYSADEVLSKCFECGFHAIKFFDYDSMFDRFYKKG